MTHIRVAVAALLAAGCGWGAVPEAGGASPPGGRPSVLLVSIDTLRADRLGAYGNGRGLTPNLDAFAREAVVFEQAWAQANVTSMSHGSLFTSRYPSELGTAGPMFRLGDEPPTLAGVLSLYGYDTAASTAGGHLAAGFGLDRGFERFDAQDQLASFWHTVPPAMAWLDERASDDPFLLLVHTYDTHSPYLQPAPYGLAWADPGYSGPAEQALGSIVGTELIFGHALFRSEDMLSFLHRRRRPRTWDDDARAAVAALAKPPDAVPFGDEDVRHVRDVYDGAAAYADAFFGVLVAGLKARGVYDDLVVVVFSDHGETLGEDGRFGHGDSVDDRELHVPLMVRLPGAPGRRVDAPVTLLDVMPTVLELAGATAPAGIRGASLVPWLRGAEGPRHDLAFSEGNRRSVSVRSSAGRLTFTGVSADSPYLPSLLRTAAIDGPAFATDTTIADPAAREPLRQALSAWRGTLETAWAKAQAPDPQAVEQMRARGYWTP